ncbi:MAG: hypothetical protein WB290_09575 [Smithella sp.]
MPEAKKNIETYLADIEKELPPVTFRNWPRWRDVLPMSPRSVANDDCVGLGPKEKIYMGRNAGYPRASLMEYLRAKSRVA